jgi:Transmembrane family 220, helix
MTIMAAAFAAAALLQYNDADALRWILVYGAAAVLSGVAAWRGAAPAAAAACLAAIALTWALVLAAGLPTVGVYAHVFDSWRMHSTGVEEARESLGLLLVAACAVVIAAAPRGRGRG